MTASPQQLVKAHWYDMRIIEVLQETSRAVTLTLESCDPHIQLFYQAGQYINVIVDINGQKFCRSYSISSAPYEEILCITVQLIDGGLVSNYLNKNIKVGQRILCSQPTGDFVIYNSKKPKLFFAAGSGITPIIAMLKNHLYNSKEPCYLFYFSHNKRETIFKKEISSLCDIYNQRLFIKHWHSTIEGRFDFDLNRLYFFEYAVNLAPDVYICGPDSWMHGLRECLESYRFGLGKIYQESFFPNRNTNEELAPYKVNEQFHNLSIDVDGQHYEFKASSNESLLVALRRNMIPITSGCEVGKCGSCMAKVNSGQVETQKERFLTPDEINEGYILCCQARARSDCSLEV